MFLYFFVVFILFLVNALHALYVTPGYSKCFSGINLSPTNNNLFNIAFINKKRNVFIVNFKPFAITSRTVRLFIIRLDYAKYDCSSSLNSSIYFTVFLKYDVLTIVFFFSDRDLIHK